MDFGTGLFLSKTPSEESGGSGGPYSGGSGGPPMTPATGVTDSPASATESSSFFPSNIISSVGASVGAVGATVGAVGGAVGATVGGAVEATVGAVGGAVEATVGAVGATVGAVGATVGSTVGAVGYVFVACVMTTVFASLFFGCKRSLGVFSILVGNVSVIFAVMLDVCDFIS